MIVLSLVGLIFTRAELVDRLRGRRAARSTRSPRRSTREQVTDVLDRERSRGLRGADRERRHGARSARPRSRRTATQSDALLQALAKQAGIDPSDINQQDVGPTWGKEISRKALTGLIVVLAAIMLYIACGSSGRWRSAPSSRCSTTCSSRPASTRCRAAGHAGDGHRHPHDPRVLAVRHRGHLRQDQGEHRDVRAWSRGSGTRTRSN